MRHLGINHAHISQPASNDAERHRTGDEAGGNVQPKRKRLGWGQGLARLVSVDNIALAAGDMSSPDGQPMSPQPSAQLHSPRNPGAIF